MSEGGTVAGSILLAVILAICGWVARAIIREQHDQTVPGAFYE